MEVLSEVRNRIAFITLNRPAALNALSLEMVSALRATLRDHAADPHVHAVLLRGAGGRAFCAGGDIRALYQSRKSSGAMHRDFFAAEYPLDYCLHFYPKPYIALMDGITMGGGMGLAQGSPIRIVGERSRIAMPEVGIGFFPDVGGSFFLSRAPGELGLYLALTGTQIGAADTLYAGLADAYLPRDSVERLEQALSQLAWSGDARADIDRTLRELQIAPVPAAPLAAVREAIDQHFAAPSVPANRGIAGSRTPARLSALGPPNPGDHQHPLADHAGRRLQAAAARPFAEPRRLSADGDRHRAPLHGSWRLRRGRACNPHRQGQRAPVAARAPWRK